VIHANGEGDEKTLFPLAMGRVVDKGGTGRRTKLWATRPWAMAASVEKWQAAGSSLTGMGLGPKWALGCTDEVG
jgi:hypothetical protein